MSLTQSTAGAGGGDLYDELMALRLQAAQFADEAADNRPLNRPVSEYEASERGKAGAYYDAAQMVKAALASAPPAGQGNGDASVERIIQAACKPWEFAVGEPPEWGSPLHQVFVAGMIYSERLLAGFLDVETYEAGDGSEDFDADATKSLQNILTAAGLYDPEEGVKATLASAPSAPTPEAGSDEDEPRTSTDAVRLWEIEQAGGPENSTEAVLVWEDERRGVVPASDPPRPSPPPGEDMAGQGEPSTETKMVCVVPVGWRLVPETPTGAMCAAGAEENVESDLEDRIYEAMLANAPPPPLTAINGADLYKIASEASDVSKLRSVLTYVIRGIHGGSAHKSTAEMLRSLAEFPAYIATVPGLEPHHLRERASFLEDAEREVAKLKADGGVR